MNTESTVDSRGESQSSINIPKDVVEKAIDAINQNDVAEKAVDVINPQKWARQTKNNLDCLAFNIVKPLMEQVVSGRIKHNLALIIAGLCAKSSYFPIDHKNITIQCLYQVMKRYKFHPSNLLKNDIQLDDVTVHVFPTWNTAYSVPDYVLNRLHSLCTRYGIDFEIFSKTGGKIHLTTNFLKVVTYFASDRGVEKQQEIWGAKKPLGHVMSQYLEPADAPFSPKPKRIP